MWADRITDSALATQLLTSGEATADELGWISEGWHSWAADPDGWILIPHGEVVIRV